MDDTWADKTLGVVAVKTMKKCVLKIIESFRESDITKEEVSKLVEGIVKESNPAFVPLCLYWVSKYCKAKPLDDKEK